MKPLLVLLALILIATLCHAELNRRVSEGALVVQWVGHPGFESHQELGWLRDVEFGLREDGVVVWRDKK